MRRPATRGVVGVVLAVTLAGCGVTAQRKPEPLPPPEPAVLPPTVTQQVAPEPSGRPLTFPVAAHGAT